MQRYYLTRKELALGIILFLFIPCIIPSFGQSVGEKTIKSVSYGTIFYVGGSGEGNYSRIQDAIKDSSSGDTVFVYDDSSPYLENVVIDKSITLVGEDKTSTVINGSIP